MEMRQKYFAIVGGGLLTVCLGQAALSDDLDSKIKYDQQQTRWKMDETRRKIEADRARMQSQMPPGHSSASRPQSSAAYGQTTASQTAVRQLFQQYKSLDLANNTQIMNLYANDANINVLGTPYTKAAYTQYVTNAYHHPASGLNSRTSYSEPVIQQVTNDSAQVKFAGTLGPATMTVFWNLRRSPNGLWQIASERFVNGRY
jgi:hypothetical protein